jgi:prefoldin subunit 5
MDKKLKELAEKLQLIEDKLEEFENTVHNLEWDKDELLAEFNEIKKLDELMKSLEKFFK